MKYTDQFLFREKALKNPIDRVKAVFSFIVFIFLASFMLFLLTGVVSAYIPVNNASVSAIKTNSIVLRWDSTSAGTSQIEYGNTTSYGNITTEDSLAYFHVQTITGLDEGATYHYRIRSKEWDGTETISPDYTFTTLTQAVLDNKIMAARADGQLPKTYYVSPTGSDSYSGLSPTYTDGNTGPWRTLKYASSKLDAGDALYLMNGIWADDPLELFSRSGIDVAPITVKAYPGANPILTGSASNWGIYTKGYSYIIIDGIEVSNYGYGIVNDGNYNTITNVYVHDIYNNAIMVTQPGQYWNTLSNSRVYNNGGQTASNAVQVLGHIKGQSGLKSHHTTIKNNTIWHTPAHNDIDLYGDMDYVTIDGNDLSDASNGLIGNPHDPGGDITYYLTIRDNNLHDQTSYEGIVTHNIFESLIYNNTFTKVGGSAYAGTIEENAANVVLLGNKFYSSNAFATMAGSGYKFFNNFVNSDSTPLQLYTGGTLGYIDGTVFTASYSGCTIQTPIQYYPTESSIELNGKCRVVPTTYAMTVRPVSGSATVTVNKFDPSLTQGNILVDFSASTIAGNMITFTISALLPGKYYTIKKSGSSFLTLQADSTGVITFSNSEWYTKSFTVEDLDPLLPQDTCRNFNEGYSTNVSDLTGYGNCEKFYWAITLVGCKIKKAPSFNYVNNYVDTVGNASLDITCMNN
jgi:hypothetical protein